MPSPIVNATIQSCILSALSNIIAQIISSYKNDTGFTIDWQPVFQFIAFTIINCPPNFLWQTFLEDILPSHQAAPSPSAIRAAAANDEKELDKEQANHQIVESHISIPNILIKFALDQTLGATFNTLLFSAAMAGLRGATWDQAVQYARQDFWPIMSAGWKLWPAVSLLNFTAFKTVEARTLVGSVAGMAWNIYLSLVSGDH